MKKCENKQCGKDIRNPRNAVYGDEHVFCNSRCFLERDRVLELQEEKVRHIQSCIGVQRGMKKAKKHRDNVLKLAECDKAIEVLKQQLNQANKELQEI